MSDSGDNTHKSDETNARVSAGSGGMKYVDEYRDRVKAQILVREIEAIAAAIETTDRRGDDNRGRA